MNQLDLGIIGFGDTRGHADLHLETSDQPQVMLLFQQTCVDMGGTPVLGMNPWTKACDAGTGTVDYVG